MNKKYNKIMDKVVVTDEMRERVLAGISNAEPGQLAARYKVDDDRELADVFAGRRRKRPKTAGILAGLAAACILFVLVGVLAMTGGSELGLMSSAEKNNTGTAEAAEEDGAFADAEFLDEAEANTVVGASGDAAADGGVVAETETEETFSDEPVNLSESEIRKIVEAYLGEDYRVSAVTEDGNMITYTVVGAASGRISSYIRIDVKTGRVAVEDDRTEKVGDMRFSDLTAE